MSKIFLPPLCIVSAILVLSAFFCQANDGTSLTINGDETIHQLGTAFYSASASNGEVTINSTKTYSANYTGYDGVPTISWRYIGGTPTGNSINIHFVTNITHHLECTLRYKDANRNNQEVTAEMYIKVLPQVELSAMRADYKDYTSAVISGTNLVYIHFNIRCLVYVNIRDKMA